MKRTSLRQDYLVLKADRKCPRSRHKNPFILVTVMIALPTLSGCIYDAPGDRFYRTLWETSEIPFTTSEGSVLTLEFLCNNEIFIKTSKTLETDSILADTPEERSTVSVIDSHSYGCYESDGNTAWFNSLSLSLNGTEINFVEAQRDGDILLLTWNISKTSEHFTTSLRRLSAYPDN